MVLRLRVIALILLFVIHRLAFHISHVNIENLCQSFLRNSLCEIFSTELMQDSSQTD